jgi:hypothetical protein
MLLPVGNAALRVPRAPPEPSSRPLIPVAAAALGAAAGVGWLIQRAWRPPPAKRQRAAQALTAGAAILCLSVALDSGLEHYRGQFKNRLMFVGPSVALLGLATAAYLTVRRPESLGRAAEIVFTAAGVTGAAGLGLHLYNILKRPGHLSASNIFYAAPAGAPAALTLAGAYGLLSARIGSSRNTARFAAGLVAVSLLGTSAEAGILHFRGAFQNPAMYAPVIVPPIAAVSIGAAALSPRSAAVAEPLLKATAVLGIAGPLLHAYGIHRNMGGWRNWSQMILQGPPLPAPPAFLGIAAAGLGVLPLLQEPRR